MPLEINLLVLCSITGLLLVLGLHAFRTASLRSFWSELVVLVIYGVFLNVVFGFPSPSGVVAKGSEASRALYVALYVCVLMGMAFQFAFRYFSQPKELRSSWDWGLFIAPFFASPLIFFPLVAAFQSSGVDFNDSRAPRLMVLMVAFQNGFFWKEIFERKQKEEKRKR